MEREIFQHVLQEMEEQLKVAVENKTYTEEQAQAYREAYVNAFLGYMGHVAIENDDK